MKKIALLGDSIRQIGYGKHVPAMLGNEYEVFQPSDNCRFAKYTMRMIYDLKNQDMHSGGSGCGCSASVTAGHFCSLLEKGKIRSTIIDKVKEALKISLNIRGEFKDIFINW